MKVVYLPLAVLLLVSDVLSADVALGGACTASDTCTAGNGAYCDTTCKCNTGFVARGNTCARVHGQVCDVSMCSAPSKMTCSSSGTCACNTAVGLEAGSSGDADCSCPTGSKFADGKCLKKIGYACNSVSECIAVSGILCADVSGTNQCTCDTTQNYAAGSIDEEACACDTTNSVMEDGSCKIKDGKACTSTPECVLHANCDSSSCACDSAGGWKAAATGKCECDSASYVLEGTTCKTQADKACTAASSCVAHSTCDVGNTDTCVCDASGNWETGAGGTCACKSGYQQRTDGSCGAEIDGTCTSASDCADTLVCTSSKCACDASKHLTGSSGILCACDSGYQMQNGVCLKMVGETCTADSECYVSSGIVCADVSGTKKCTCDTTKNFNAGSAGDTSCTCETNYQLTNGVCALEVGQACTSTSTSTPCVAGAICDKKTKTCICDDANGFLASGAACTCKSGFTSSGSFCLAHVGGFCSSKDKAEVCVSGASCKDNPDTTTALDYSCTCSGTALFDGTCSGASVGSVISLALLIAGLLVTSHLT